MSNTMRIKSVKIISVVLTLVLLLVCIPTSQAKAACTPTCSSFTCMGYVGSTATYYTHTVTIQTWDSKLGRFVDQQVTCTVTTVLDIYHYVCSKNCGAYFDSATTRSVSHNICR